MQLPPAHRPSYYWDAVRPHAGDLLRKCKVPGPFFFMRGDPAGSPIYGAVRPQHWPRLPPKGSTVFRHRRNLSGPLKQEGPQPCYPLPPHGGGDGFVHTHSTYVDQGVRSRRRQINSFRGTVLRSRACPLLPSCTCCPCALVPVPPRFCFLPSLNCLPVFTFSNI